MLINKIKNKTNSLPLVVNYTSNSLTYLGRWNNGTYGKTSGWPSSLVQFRVRNTSIIKVKSYINRTLVNGGGAFTLRIDNDPNFFTPISFESDTAAFSGYRTQSYTLPNDGNWHTITLHLAALPIDQFNKDIEMFLDSLTFDSGAEISILNKNKTLQCVGDSWMGSSNDWPRLIDSSVYNCYNIAGGGMTCSDMNTRYDYDYNSVLNSSDTNVDAILVSFGVNDYLASVTTGTFESTLSALVDKIRAKQSTAKIFLIRVPNNGASLYGQYGTVMSNVAASKSNCIYLDTSSLDASLDWLDAFHLGSNGKLILADYVKTQLIANNI